MFEKNRDGPGSCHNIAVLVCCRLQVAHQRGAQKRGERKRETILSTRRFFPGEGLDYGVSLRRQELDADGSCWNSKKQSVVALSTAEAEYIHWRLHLVKLFG